MYAGAIQTVMKRGMPLFQIYAMNAAHAELLHSLANNDPNVRGCMDVIRGVAQAAVDLEDPGDGETMEVVMRLIEQAVTYGVMMYRVLDTEGRSVSKADFRADPETELGDMEVMLRGDMRHLGEDTRATEIRTREATARRMKTRSDQDMRRNTPRRPRRLRNKYRIVPLDMADCKMVLRYELRTGLMAMIGMPREKTGIQGEERGKYIFTKIITPPDRWRVDMAGARFASPVARCLEYHFMRQRMYDAELMAMERNAARTVLRQPPGVAQNISDLQSASSHNILQNMLPNHNVTGVPGYYVEDEAELGQVEAVNRFFEHTRNAALRRQQMQQSKADQDYLDPLQRQVDATRVADTYEQYRKFRVDRKRVESARNSTRPIDAGELKDQTPFTHSRNMPDMLREIQNSICEMMGVPVAALGVVAAGRSDRTTTADGATPSPQVYNNIAGIMIAIKGIMDRVMPGRMEIHTREAVQRASIRPDQFALLKGILSRREMRRIIGFTSETDELDAVVEERMFDLMTARAEVDQLAEMVKDAAGRTDLTSSAQMAKVANALAVRAERLREREERMALAARAASNNGEGSAGSAPLKPATLPETPTKRASKFSSGAAKAKAEGGAEDGGAKRPSKQRPSAEGGTGQRTGDEKPSKRAK